MSRLPQGDSAAFQGTLPICLTLSSVFTVAGSTEHQLPQGRDPYLGGSLV